MATYLAKPDGKLTFNLTREGEPAGSLHYKSWFSYKARIFLQDGKELGIEPKGFWGSTIEIKEEDSILIKLRVHWNGNIILHTFFDQEEKGLLIKSKGIFNNVFVLCDEDNTELMQLKPTMNWSKLNYEYAITTDEAIDKINEQVILTLVSVYCANYYMAIANGMAGSMAAV